jgi:NADH:ubiquinone oxidoreductase subunit K
MQLQLQYFLLLAAALFCIGIYGLITSRNAVRVLMSIELLLNAVNLNLMGFSNFIDPQEIKGQVFTVFVIRRDDSAICAAPPASYRATDQTVQLLGWHSSNKSAEIDRLVETAEKSKLGSP